MHFLGSFPTLPAQQYTISTLAGGVPPPTPAPALSVGIGAVQAVATDTFGNVYFSSLNCVFKLDSTGTVTRYAGNSRAYSAGDGGAAINAALYSPTALATDSSGNLYIAELNRVRRVSPNGVITTVAGGGGSPGKSGDPGNGDQATSAYLAGPSGVAVDASGNLYISELTGGDVRKVSPDGIISIVAGTGIPGFSGDGGPAASAQLFEPSGLAVDAAGGLYIADVYNDRIRKVSPSGIITTVAGNGVSGFSGDGGPATSAELFISEPAVFPVGIAVDAAGDLFISDLENSRVREVTPGGTITTVASLGATQPFGVAVDPAGKIYVALSSYEQIGRFSPGGAVTVVAGSGTCCFSGDGGLATSAQMNYVSSVTLDNAGNVYVTDTGVGNDRVRRISPGGLITTVAGGDESHLGDGGLAVNANLKSPSGVAVDSAGNIYIADSDNYRVRKVSSTGIITTVAGNGTRGYSGDGGQATSAQLSPWDVAVSPQGSLLITDLAGNAVRVVSASGIITTLAGNGTAGYSGDGGPASAAELNNPRGIALDSSGNMWIADGGNCRVRKVSTGGVISTVAGSPLGCFYQSLGDGGPAIGAGVVPFSVAVDAAGNLYIAEVANNRVRMVNAAGIIDTFAGGNSPTPGTGFNYTGYSGDGGPASSALFGQPTGVALDGAANLYVADSGNHAVRLVQPLPSAGLGVVSSASALAGSVSPGEIIALYGSGLGPAQLSVASPGGQGFFPTQSAATQVFFDGIPAPLIYSSSAQTAAIVPYGVAGPTTSIQIQYQGRAVASQSAPVAAVAPAIFTANASGAGPAAALNQDGSLNGSSNPAKLGSVIVLFATGEGQSSPAGVDGMIAGSSCTTADSARHGVDWRCIGYCKLCGRCA